MSGAESTRRYRVYGYMRDRGADSVSPLTVEQSGTWTRATAAAVAQRMANQEGHPMRVATRGAFGSFTVEPEAG